MTSTDELRAAAAAVAREDQFTTLLHDPSTLVIRALLTNRHLREEDALVLAERSNLPADLLAEIARDKRWADSYPVRLALARNPKTPLSASLTIIRYLRLFDIAELSRSSRLPLVIRNKIETILIERIPALPLGYKKTLAKMAVGNVLVRLLQDPDGEVVALCLDNPRLQEHHLFKIIGRDDTPATTIRMIAGHRSWSIRSLIRYALVRNRHTPLTRSELFLQSMKLRDLRELSADPLLPGATGPLVHRELMQRGREPGKPAEEETIFELNEDDDAELDAYAAENEEDGAAGDGSPAV